MWGYRFDILDFRSSLEWKRGLRMELGSRRYGDLPGGGGAATRGLRPESCPLCLPEVGGAVTAARPGRSFSGCFLENR